ncbi:D-sedoheptulose 7-phosphate isomerase [Succinispira mobilis]|uniref:D-sedoheptulose 7-phosphate isomerase n=1 Tax=Succinispira mobilis TaxID=78120 RepID=UPI0003632819|nr:D-sedoheptulose 7-phosphate isomerase [Succinispira mobilis]
MQEIIQQRIAEHINVAQALYQQQGEKIEVAASVLAWALKTGKKVLFCGNGGSAADAQHLAAEFVGRYLLEREGLPAIALTTDTSILTAVANDYDFANVFARQVQALGNNGDVLIGISTSGNSPNVVRAIEVAKAKGIATIGFTGQGGGKMRELCDVCLAVDSKVTARTQEMHILMGHILCELLDGVLINHEK